jgi:hypothetical protein
MAYNRPVHRAASCFVLLLVAGHAAGCGGRQQENSSPPDASADGAADGAGDHGGSGAGDDGGSAVGDDSGNAVADDSGNDGGSPLADDSGSDAGPPPATTFPLGTYDDCAFTTFLQTPGGGGTTEYGGSVTLGQSGSVLSVAYGGDGGALDASLAFTQTSGLSASLEPGQQVGGVQVVCGPLDFAPSVVQLGSGSLTYNAGALFLSVIGTADPVDAGGGCSNPGGPAALAITCTDPPASPSPAAGIDAGSSDAGLGSDFAGVYSCASTVLSSSSSLESLSAGKGALTITETGAVVTAAYANDPFVQGSLAFVATTEGVAFPATANESVQVNCTTDPPVPGGPQMIALPVKGGTLTIDGSSVVLSLVGTMPEGSGCGGAETDVSLLCSK